MHIWKWIKIIICTILMYKLFANVSFLSSFKKSCRVLRRILLNVNWPHEFSFHYFELWFQKSNSYLQPPHSKSIHTNKILTILCLARVNSTKFLQIGLHGNDTENTAGNNFTNPRPVPQRIELAQASELKVNSAEYLMVQLNQVMDH